MFDVGERKLLYTSPIVSTSPVTRVAALPKIDATKTPGFHYNLCLGTHSGQVHLYHLTLKASKKHWVVVRSVHIFDVKEALLPPKRKPWERKDSKNAKESLLIGRKPIVHVEQVVIFFVNL